MSLQRIFESARKLGLPVIVTDSAGREPMVVLPLEQFEAMAGAGEMREPEPVLASQSLERVEPEDIVSTAPISGIVDSTPSIAAENKHFSSEISLDEGFYLDPLEDETAI